MDVLKSIEMSYECYGSFIIPRQNYKPEIIHTNHQIMEIIHTNHTSILQTIHSELHKIFFS